MAVLNQGGFGNGNASLSYVSNDFVTFQNNIFCFSKPNNHIGGWDKMLDYTMI
jgi:hypothetical protein